MQVKVLESGGVIKAPCNSCGAATNHHVIAAHSTPGNDGIHNPENFPDWENVHAILRCSGCDALSFRADIMDLEDGTEVIYYPPRIARRAPGWQHDLPDKVWRLMHEVYVALANNCPTLAIMGARSLIDMVALRKVGDVGPFPRKLEALESVGVIGREHREQLDSALNVGNAAAHRGYIPSAEVVGHVMDIVENLLQTVYVLPTAARRLRREAPRRKRKLHRKPAV